MISRKIDTSFGLVENPRVPLLVVSGGWRNLLEQRTKLLQRMVDFFNGREASVTVSHSLKIMKLLEATQRAYDSGKTEPWHSWI